MINEFKKRTAEENAQALADLFPQGISLQAKGIPDTVFRKYLRALGKTISRFQADVETLSRGFIPNENFTMVAEWDQFIEIPDDCFTTDNVDDGNLNIQSDRYRDIIIKLAKLNLYNAQTYYDLADALGITIEINNSTDGFNQFYWQIKIFGVQDLNGWDYDWDIVWGDKFTNLIECLFNKQKPAHTYLIFTYVQS